MNYEWHEPKRRLNRSYHGIDFADTVDFDWSSALVVMDTRFDYGETRYIAIGWLHGRLVILVFTERQETIRLISLRRANSHERKQYETRFQD